MSGSVDRLSACRRVFVVGVSSGQVLNIHLVSAQAAMSQQTSDGSLLSLPLGALCFSFPPSRWLCFIFSLSSRLSAMVGCCTYIAELQNDGCQSRATRAFTISLL